MGSKESWQKSGGFKAYRSGERKDALRIEIGRATLFLKLFCALILLVVVEYFLCGIYYRPVRQSDLLWLDLGCSLAAVALCYWVSRKLMRDALKERIPFYVVAVLFLIFTFLVGGFFRFSAQLANGLLDFNDPEVHRITVTEKKVSVFGGSLREGPNPMAHMVYFKDWDNGTGKCEILLPPAAYYLVDPTGPLDIAVRPGLFHMAWLQAFQLVQPQIPEGAGGN